MSNSIHGSCVLLRNQAGEYLMQLRDGNPAIKDPLLWDFFGGAQESGEDILMCAVRELKEELNLQIHIDELSLVTEIEESDRVHHLIHCSRLVEWGDFTVQEGAGCAFLNVDELMRVPLCPYVKKFITNGFASVGG